jgi:hypothetical protein
MFRLEVCIGKFVRLLYLSTKQMNSSWMGVEV